MSTRALPYVAAVCTVLPLLAVEVWSGFRIGLSDPVLSVIAPSEQPLSVRSPGGEWAMLVALAWFGLAYWRRRLTLWEAVLVVAGGAAALLRFGNAWLFALAMVVPLARQLARLSAPRLTYVGVAALGLAVTAYTLYATRPPALPPAAERAAVAAHVRGEALVDWRWAPTLQPMMTGHVLGASGLASESPTFWTQYVRVVQGHERWAEDLHSLNVDLVVLDAADARPVVDLVRDSVDWHVTYDADGVLVAERAGS